MTHVNFPYQPGYTFTDGSLTSPSIIVEPRYRFEQGGQTAPRSTTTQPTELYRAMPEVELRDDDGTGMPTMTVNFARFNEWTEINSMWEGRFLEQFAPGAFKKTFREQGKQIRSLFQHGQDPQVASKPLGTISDLREEADGAWADVQLLDADYVREILPGIRAGLYGASMAFMPVRENSAQPSKASDYNPLMLEERTVKEARLREFGPVTFPAYSGTSTSARSLTDNFLVARAVPALRDDTVQEIPDEAPADEATPLDVLRMRHELMARRHPGRRA